MPERRMGRHRALSTTSDLLPMREVNHRGRCPGMVVRLSFLRGVQSPDPPPESASPGAHIPLRRNAMRRKLILAAVLAAIAPVVTHAPFEARPVAAQQLVNCTVANGDAP